MLIASLPTSTFSTPAAAPSFCKKFNNNFNQENNCTVGLRSASSISVNNQLSQSFTAMSNNFINSEENSGNVNVNEWNSENIDARSRFSHTKALFEQLERCNGDNIPSFYSPRLQRSSNKPSNVFSATMPKTNVVAPMVPLKPATTNHIFQQKRNAFDLASSKESNNNRTPLSQVERNFSQLASDLERITSTTRNVSSINSSTQLNDTKISLNINSFANSTSKFTNSTKKINNKNLTTSIIRNTQLNATNNNLTKFVNNNNGNQNINDSTQNGSCYEPYWRDPSFYKRRLGVDTNEKNEANFLNDENSRDMNDDENNSIESGESVPSEPRPSSNNQQQQNIRIASYNKNNCSVSPVHQQFIVKPATTAEYTTTTNEQALETEATSTPPSFMMIHHTQKSSGINNFKGDQQPSGELLMSNSPSSSTSSVNETNNYFLNLNGVKNKKSQPSLNKLVETIRGLSPDRESLNRKVSFSTAPIKIFKTHGVDEYDRRNEEIDPVASCAEYELERRLDKMELFDVELVKGSEGLGVSIIGMGVGADAGLEKLGIFVKSITHGGAVHRDGRICVCDQIVSVDGISLVGVSQLFAAQTLRATSSCVTFTIGRESNLEDSEVAQLIQQSLEQDQLKLMTQQQLQQQQRQQKLINEENNAVNRLRHQTEQQSIGSFLSSTTSNDRFNDESSYDADEDSSRCQNFQKTSSNALEENPNELMQIKVPMRAKEFKQHQQQQQTSFVPNLASSVLKSSEKQTNTVIQKEEEKIKTRIRALESELDGSQKEAEQMRDVLENTRTHYTQLENKYDQARQLLKNYQEREKELLEREETHVVQLREKDAHYSDLIGQLKSRIDELENKLDQMAKRRTSVVEGELTELREQLAACAEKRNCYNTNSENKTKYNTLSMQRQKNDKKNIKSDKHEAEYLHEKVSNIDGAPPPPMHCASARTIRHAGLSQQAISLSAVSSALPQHYERFIMNGVHLTNSGAAPHIYSSATPLEDSIYTLSGGFFDNSAANGYVIPTVGAQRSNCESPVPRISEPASPAMPQKFLNNHNSQQKNRILFPLRKRYIQAENEFWRENVEAQGLQVLQWNTDEVCQMLIHIGLDKYIPEFTVNEINGPKFLELDGSRLKSMGIYNHSDRSIIKKKIKTIKSRIERERKLLERESRARASNNNINSGTNNNAQINGISAHAMKMISIHQ